MTPGWEVQMLPETHTLDKGKMVLHIIFSLFGGPASLDWLLVNRCWEASRWSPAGRSGPPAEAALMHLTFRIFQFGMWSTAGLGNVHQLRRCWSGPRRQTGPPFSLFSRLLGAVWKPGTLGGWFPSQKSIRETAWSHSDSNTARHKTRRWVEKKCPTGPETRTAVLTQSQFDQCAAASAATLMNVG